ncbi:hypothetical protein [Halomonas urumqiensis]|uniref:Uncharacterized protein n=1 Tax=Halomonas urumqiensis TaxID=1684789 RepID=A0A2N7UF97_9GAMM|nr:hypothetical protein [Halomonas urumqiensis]PMR79107.1 hypothetical protein C1H70_12425 [Halomonas urumqiensis]PTB03781.1 hypothetical protein C6V82_04710 [Halomonas urumqiensis]GHE19989.1 hypothetical protein GCM10017767_05100 [Halomonas urumqiensis]
MTPMNIWRSQSHIRIDNACLLLAGIDPWEVDPECPALAMDDALWGPFAAIEWAYEHKVRDAEQLVRASAWLGRAKRAVIAGELEPSDEEDRGLVRVWRRLPDMKEEMVAKEIDEAGQQIGAKYRPVKYEIVAYELADIIDFEQVGISETHLDFDFDVSRADLARWLMSLGWAESELPDFLAGICKAPAPNESAEVVELRTLEVFGLLAELYAGQRGPDYRHGERPKVARIVTDMLEAMPADITKMGDRKLKEHISAAIKAWENKKRR